MLHSNYCKMNTEFEKCKTAYEGHNAVHANSELMRLPRLDKTNKNYPTFPEAPKCVVNNCIEMFRENKLDDSLIPYKNDITNILREVLITGAAFITVQNFDGKFIFNTYDRQKLLNWETDNLAGEYRARYALVASDHGQKRTKYSFEENDHTHVVFEERCKTTGEWILMDKNVYKTNFDIITSNGQDIENSPPPINEVVDKSIDIHRLNVLLSSNFYMHNTDAPNGCIMKQRDHFQNQLNDIVSSSHFGNGLTVHDVFDSVISKVKNRMAEMS